MDAVTTAAAEAGEYVSTFDPNDKYIGLALAVSSSVAIGTSFIITKKARPTLSLCSLPVLTGPVR